jgi:hypothetical protein
MIVDSELFLDDPRDVLHRLTPTPFRCGIQLGKRIIRVASNDPLLLPPVAPNESLSLDRERLPFFWKLVRDPKAPGTLDSPIQFSMPGGVTAVFFGTACLIAIDEERSQLVSFVNVSVDATYRELVLPILYKLSDRGSDGTEYQRAAD